MKIRSDSWVQRSTGHRQYPNRLAEARFILHQFDMNYKARALKKGARGECLESVREIVYNSESTEDSITPELLFRLRTFYHRSKKLMDAEGGA